MMQFLVAFFVILSVIGVIIDHVSSKRTTLAKMKRRDEAAQVLGYENAHDLMLKTRNADFTTPPGMSRVEAYKFYMVALSGDNYNP